MSLDPDMVAMDACHIQLIAAVMGSLKPGRILEMGYGSGRLTRAILQAQTGYQIDAKYTLVDAWLDWDGGMPADAAELEDRIHIVTSLEETFVDEAVKSGQQFDLIISDADHNKSDHWFPGVFEMLLAPGGIGFFHDVRAEEYNLWRNIEYCKVYGVPHKVFIKNSLPDERCGRGLLMVMKP